MQCGRPIYGSVGELEMSKLILVVSRKLRSVEDSIERSGCMDGEQFSKIFLAGNTVCSLIIDSV